MSSSMAARKPMSDNVRACLLMVVTMAGFSVEDLIIKWAAADIPVGQLLTLLGFGGAGAFAVISLVILRRPLWHPLLTRRPVLLRNAAEVVSTTTGISALVLIPLSLASSILQAAPILVAAGAAIFLGERVGWRRWTAIAVGLVGVIMILRPGPDGLSAGVWLSVIAVIGVAFRDLATRATPSGITTLQLAFWGYATTILSGAILTAITRVPWVWPDAQGWLMLGMIQLLGIVFYYTLTLALMIGESSVVVPFRYSRLVFALALGVLVLDEQVDLLMLLGLALVTASGLYTLLREARLARRRASHAGVPPV